MRGPRTLYINTEKQCGLTGSGHEAVHPDTDILRLYYYLTHRVEADVLLPPRHRQSETILLPDSQGGGHVSYFHPDTDNLKLY